MISILNLCITHFVVCQITLACKHLPGKEDNKASTLNNFALVGSLKALVFVRRLVTSLCLCKKKTEVWTL